MDPVENGEQLETQKQLKYAEEGQTNRVLGPISDWNRFEAENVGVRYDAKT